MYFVTRERVMFAPSLIYQLSSHNLQLRFGIAEKVFYTRKTIIGCFPSFHLSMLSKWLHSKNVGA